MCDSKSKLAVEEALLDSQILATALVQIVVAHPSDRKWRESGFVGVVALHVLTGETSARMSLFSAADFAK
jgi:hypothetical protein